MDVTRLMPVALALGSAGVVANGGGKVATQVVDTVKAVLTRSELSQIAKLLEADSALGKRPPRDAAGLKAWLGENMRGRSGRDPADDLWGHPYRIARQDRERVVLSLGPNGKRDRCAGTAGEDAKRAREATERELRGEAQPEQTGDDDLCVTLNLVTVKAPKGDRSPFRSMHER